MASLIGSKAKQEAFEGCSPEPPGRLLEPGGNVRSRWMAIRTAYVV